MRAKTLAIAMFSAVTLFAPVAKADCQSDKVGNASTTTFSETTIVTPAVVETTTVLPLTITIVQFVPDDMTVRERELKLKIDEKLAAGSITSSEADSLRTAMAAVDNTQANFRSDGHVSFKEAKTLYRAMDQVGSDLDFYVEDPSIFGLPLRTEHVLRNWSI